MQKKIAAPEGYEGQVYFDVDSQIHKPAFRKIGATWWTLAYRDAGHAHLHEDEVTRRAEDAIRHAIAHRKDQETRS